ncbi:hypothetical protein JYK21_07305 [Ralstonia pickettii]|nr:hypothetical protein [Ralstonia pickettii]
MTDQLQEAKDWLGDLSKIVSQQKTKEDYEYTKKRTDLMEWLINRVEELEKDKERLVTALEDEMNLTARMCELQDMEREEKEHYKQALEFYANEDNFTQSESEYFEGYPPEVMNDRGYKARKALECESE